MNLSKLVHDLKQERKRLDAAIAALEGATMRDGVGRRKSRTISLAGRQRIAAAQRARWARLKKNKRG